MNTMNTMNPMPPSARRIAARFLGTTAPMATAYGPPGASSGPGTAFGPWYDNPDVVVDRPEWKRAAGDARRATQEALPPCRCMGPTATIKDDGRGPVLNLEYGHPITPEDIQAMARAVSALGWRGWVYNERGISFKPTTVDLG